MLALVYSSRPIYVPAINRLDSIARAFSARNPRSGTAARISAVSRTDCIITSFGLFGVGSDVASFPMFDTWRLLDPFFPFSTRVRMNSSSLLNLCSGEKSEHHPARRMTTHYCSYQMSQSRPAVRVGLFYLDSPIDYCYIFAY